MSRSYSVKGVVLRRHKDRLGKYNRKSHSLYSDPLDTLPQVRNVFIEVRTDRKMLHGLPFAFSEGILKNHERKRRLSEISVHKSDIKSHLSPHDSIGYDSIAL